MSLTDELRFDLRRDCGDIAPKPDLEDEELERIWTRADGDYETAVAYALRQRWAMAEPGSAKASQIKAQLDFWQRQIGIQVGSLDLGIDEFSAGSEWA